MLRSFLQRQDEANASTRNGRIWGQEFESPRARHSATAKASPACAASSRILAATPRRCSSQPKISKTTPCKVAGGRRQGRFGPILDTSGKSMALLHHRTIRKRSLARNGAPFGVILGENPYPRLENPYPRLKVYRLVKLQWLAAASDRLRVAKPLRFRRTCRRHRARHNQRRSSSRATHSRLGYFAPAVLKVERDSVEPNASSSFAWVRRSRWRMVLAVGMNLAMVVAAAGFVASR